MTETVYTLPGVPKLALLSDLHARPYQHVTDSLRKNRPEMICIAGDCFYGSRPEDDVSPLVSQPNVLPFLEVCAQIAPTYLSLGNHEQWLDDQDLESIRKTGTVILDNEWMERDGFVIGGLTSGYCTDYRRFRAGLPAGGERYPEDLCQPEKTHLPDTTWLKDFVAVPGRHLLICHHPEYFPLIPEDILVLAGHAHGGQWRLFGHGVFAPGQGFWPKYTKGVYEGRLVVSAGLSNTARIPRFFNPTEVVYLRSSI